MIQLHDSKDIEFFSADTSIILDLPLVSSGISIGFPNPGSKMKKAEISSLCLFCF